MDLTIQQNCPSCGAEIELNEADRLIQCPYCEVNNFMVNRGLLRFVLPDKAPVHIDRREMFYAPYLRFKGNIYYCTGTHLKHRVIDTTQRGVNSSVLPLSLGLRPQAMRISLVTDMVSGSFFRQTVKARTLLEKASQPTVHDSEKIKASLYSRAYIGESLSCIYLPLYIEDGVLYDAVINKPLAHGGSAESLQKKSDRYHPGWTPHFLATLCPHCGDTLTGEHDSLVLSCCNCHSSWEEKQGGFHPISWQRVVSHHDHMYYLPFWKLEVRSTGVEMNNFADFLRITNQPLVVQPVHEQMVLSFWIPAFKLKPKTFIQLAKNMTVSQRKLPGGEQTMIKGMHPVTLQRTEAVQALKSVMAEAALNKQQLLPLLPGMSFHPLASDLTYLPFFDRGHDFVQEQSGLSLAKSVLRFGRSL
ncbi:MAG: hypothetical protein KKH60_01470 [Proteobacteria bacterium]|nr:hypothetical protein [Pseudomonadota bacterium]